MICDNCGIGEVVYFGKRSLCSSCLRAFEEYRKARDKMRELGAVLKEKTK